MAISLTSLADAVNVHSQTSVVKLVVDLLSALIHALLGDACREITRKELMKDVPLAAGLGDAHADATGHDTSGDRARDGGDDGHWSRAELLEERSVKGGFGRPLGGCTYLEKSRDGDDREGGGVGGNHFDCLRSSSGLGEVKVVMICVWVDELCDWLVADADLRCCLRLGLKSRGHDAIYARR